MKTLKMLINSATSGKYRIKMIGGRRHIVTNMMPIRGDTSMNGIYYSDKEVNDSFMQLNNLPCPSGHPEVNGVAVAAYHPVANNKHNIGAFMMNPVKRGKNVFVDFALDEEVANNSDAGKETIRRIKAGEKIGVSTGLGIEEVTNKEGVDDFNVAYNRVGKKFHFDHVAILLNEQAAGLHAGTELILNADEGEVIVHNAEWQCGVTIEQAITDAITKVDNEIDITIESVYENSVVYCDGGRIFKQCFTNTNSVLKLESNRVEVVKNPDQYIPLVNNTEVPKMDKAALILAIITNSANAYTVGDNAKLTAMTDADLMAIVATNTMSEDTAKTYLATNHAFDATGYADFIANKTAFTAFNAEKALAEKAVVDHIVTNSDFTAEMLAGKSAEELTVITNMLKGKPVAKRAGEQHVTNNDDKATTAEVDYS